ncbi:MAG: hypothetical protein R3292_10545 [Alcanivorax sp.]|nr:hypothetical protein [Alcanivorax sp.]
MRLFREKASNAVSPLFEPVLISESSDLNRLKKIARNTATFDLGVDEVEWEEGFPEHQCMRLRLSGDYYFVIRP